VFLELVDWLRCVAPQHASVDDVPLIAAIERLEGRSIALGSLGCPACGARYAIRNFVVDFGAGPVARAAVPAPEQRPDAEDEDAVLRAAALLDARSPGGFFVLGGEWGRIARALAISYDVTCLLFNPPPDVSPGDGVSIARVALGAPLAAGSARGMVADGAIAGVPTLWTGSIRAVRGGGRIVAPASIPVPDSVTALARDDQWWVGERTPDLATLLSIGRSAR
jgi:hypothetical protein